MAPQMEKERNGVHQCACATCKRHTPSVFPLDRISRDIIRAFEIAKEQLAMGDFDLQSVYMDVVMNDDARTLDSASLPGRSVYTKISPSFRGQTMRKRSMDRDAWSGPEWETLAKFRGNCDLLHFPNPQTTCVCREMSKEAHPAVLNGKLDVQALLVIQTFTPSFSRMQPIESSHRAVLSGQCNDCHALPLTHQTNRAVLPVKSLDF